MSNYKYEITECPELFRMFYVELTPPYVPSEGL